MILLLDSVDANTVGEGFSGLGTPRQLIVFADGYGGGTVSIETSFNNADWAPVEFDGAALTFAANNSVTCPTISSDAFIRAVLSGATAPSNVSVFWG